MWIPVAERIPRVGRLVDVWSRRMGRTANCYVDHVNEEGAALWYDRAGGYVGQQSVTHWMEIPDPPAEV